MSQTRQNFADQMYYPRQVFADVAGAIGSRISVAAITSLTASRTITLPAANTVQPDLPLTIVDESGALTSGITITISAAGTDKINGLASLPVLTAPYFTYVLSSDGTSKWTVRAFGLGLASGNTILNGAGAPANSIGNNGDFYIDTTNSRLYGPKSTGAWPGSYVSMAGTQGTPGTAGTNGNTILNGSGAPASGLGNNGDFYIDTTNSRLYGPKASGAWPGTFVSLAGGASFDVNTINALSDGNLIINPMHNINQQYVTTAVAAAANAYFSDQWAAHYAGSWAGTFQQVASPFTSQPDITTATKLNITTAASLGANDFVGFYQPIEGTFLSRMAYGTSSAKNASIGFMARSSIALTGYLALRIFNSSGTVIRSFLRKFTLAANTDTFVPIPTIPGDTATTLLLTTAASMQVAWNFGAGANFQGTVDAWQSKDALAGSDVTNLAAAANNNVIVSGCYFLPGSVTVSQASLSMLARQWTDEMLKCQRYYNKTCDYDYPPASAHAQITGNPQGYMGAIYIGQADSGGFYSALWEYPVEMRIQPAFAVLNANSGAAGTAYSNQSGNSYNANAVFAGRRRASVVGQGAAAGNNFIFHATASARM